MIAAWMTYALVVALLVSCAALSAERIALLRRVQSRWIWVAAMLLTVALPLLFGWQGSRMTERPATTLAALARDKAPVYELTPIAWVGGAARVVERRFALDTWLLAGWSTMSALALVTLTMGWLQLRRRLQSATDERVDGVNVSISHDVGPAVVGIVRPRIVIPRWLLQQDVTTQRIVLAHELEHLRARDVRVLGAALLVAALIPWNLPVWWQLRRLRFAMEVDCDSRVLRGGQTCSTSYVGHRDSGSWRNGYRASAALDGTNGRTGLCAQCLFIRQSWRPGAALPARERSSRLVRPIPQGCLCNPRMGSGLGLGPDWVGRRSATGRACRVATSRLQASRGTRRCLRRPARGRAHRDRPARDVRRAERGSPPAVRDHAR